MSTLMKKDACQLLDADHIAVKHLLVAYARKAMADPEGSAAERLELARQACRDLTVHATLEEEIFYPALRQAVPAAADVVGEGEEEHQEIKDLVAQVQGMDTAGPELDALVSELARTVEHHVKEERDELFPKAKSAQGLDLDALGERLRVRQQELAGG
ncbi:MAG TPA: hemerythrin domain-containing protein [Ramlibacter sp.]|nr:hemerythrin domain-containing protein [Ramlibacter sp.]